MKSHFKTEKLGLNFSTAQNRLRKMVLFDLLKQVKKNICFRCNKKIEKIEDLSLEHKISWMNSDTPKKLFFDVNNIAFSHTICNYGHKT